MFLLNNSEVYHYNLSKMISSAIKNRTQEVNKQLNQVWCEKWMEYIMQHPEHPWHWNGISQNIGDPLYYIILYYIINKKICIIFRLNQLIVLTQKVN